jgi:hypothetical protein
MQGMWNTRHSFSKYCLEKSTVPVVVVRPEDVRSKKKDKRARDPSRNSYARMLSATNGVHESDVVDDHLLLSAVTQLSSDDEASQVAKALCLPAEFDPVVRSIAARNVKATRDTPAIVIGQAPDEADGADAGAEEARARKAPGIINDSRDDDDDNDDNDDDDDDDDDGDDGPGAEPEPDTAKLVKLHEMEVGEAAALRRKPEEGDMSYD